MKLIHLIITFLFVNTLSAFAQDDGVCARVKIRLTQDITLTRTVFEGRLEISNTSPDIQLDQLRVTLDIRDDADTSANDKFGLVGPTVEGITGLDGTATLSPGQTAKGTWKITPLRTAAPTEDVRYFVGGTIEYYQSGTRVTIPMFPAPITVKPDPFLFLHYFWQRDVYSDDPFTPLVELPEPFALGLLVINSGYGAARNMNVVSSKPQIIENERGLLIDFDILGSRVDDEPFQPGLNTSLGDVPALSTRTATWFMTSTLQGKFISYNATLKHVTELGNPLASLIEGVAIHELEHVVRVLPEDDAKPDYLANDDADPDSLPDTLYSSTGDILPVGVELGGTVPNGPVSASHLTVQLNLPGVHSGWTYIRLPDPGNGKFPILRVIRADSSEVQRRDNVWQTSRTKRSGNVATRENRLYIFDKDPTTSYTLVYGLPSARYGSAGGLKTQEDDFDVKFGRDPGAGSGGGGGTGGGGWNPGDPNVGGGDNTGGQTELIATATFGTYIYAETIDRSSGIRINLPGSAPAIHEGDSVYGQGKIQTSANGERIILATAISVGGTGRIEAIGMTTRSLYSGDFFLDSNGAGQRGMKDGNGLNVVGLLVRTLGAVTEVQSGYFRIDDGYGRSVKVLLPTSAISPLIGFMVDVSGIAFPESIEGDLYPVIRPRSLDDLTYAGSPFSLASPLGTLLLSWNLFALPGVPAPADVPAVMASVTANSASLSGRLARYDAPTQQEIFYQSSTSGFGSFLSGDGYRLRVDSGEITGASRFSFQGYGNDFADHWLSLPKLGAAVIGMPFPFSVPWESLQVTNGIETLTLRQASQMTPPWLDSVAEYWDNVAQVSKFLGLPEDARDSAAFEPWRGYRMTANRNNIALITPTVGTPVLEQMAPNGALTGSRGVTLIVTGSNFRTGSKVFWNGLARPTTFLSSTRLRADIPPSDLTTERTVSIAVGSPAKVSAPASSTEFSSIRPFYVTRAPKLVLTNVPSMARTNNVLTLTLEITNQGGVSATSVLLTSTFLGAASTTSSLPALGTLAAGASTTVTLSFPGAAGEPGSSVLLRVAGTFTGGSFTTNRKVTLP
ncbi:MAG: IPT/TIG domain-containing protein [Armatimonas sp.]